MYVKDRDDTLPFRYVTSPNGYAVWCQFLKPLRALHGLLPVSLAIGPVICKPAELLGPAQRVSLLFTDEQKREHSHGVKP